MKARVLPRAALAPGDVAAMYALFVRHFDNVSRATFARDLQAKKWALLLEDANTGALRGFSTLDVYHAEHAGRRVRVVYSGDTIVARSARASTLLSRAWIELVKRLHQETSTPLFWLLIVSGFRTYRFLPVYAREFYPRHDRPTPAAVKSLMDHLARDRFGELYDAASGIVRFAQAQCLRPELAAIPHGRFEDPHVAFFAERNPGHARGDELVCLAELAWENLTAAGRRMWLAAEREHVASEVG